MAWGADLIHEDALCAKPTLEASHKGSALEVLELLLAGQHAVQARAVRAVADGEELRGREEGEEGFDAHARAHRVVVIGAVVVVVAASTAAAACLVAALGIGALVIVVIVARRPPPPVGSGDAAKRRLRRLVELGRRPGLTTRGSTKKLPRKRERSMVNRN